MIYILVFFGMCLLILSINLVERKKYIGCILYIIAAIIFINTGIYFIKHQEILIGILQFVAAISAIVASAMGKSTIDDYFN